MKTPQIWARTLVFLLTIALQTGAVLAGVGVWSPIGPPDESATVRAIAFAPSDPHIVYAGLIDGGVQKSLDGGVTWQQASTGLSNPFVNAVTVSPSNPNVVYAATQGGFFRSKDGGVSWQGSAVVAGINCHAVAVNPSKPSILYVGTAKGAYTSTDGGLHLQLMSTGLPPPIHFNFEVEAVAIDPLNPQVVYLSHIGIQNGIHKSVDGGKVWTPIKRFTVDSLSVRGDVLWAAGNDGVFLSRDAGTTWAKVRVEPAHSLLVDPFDPQTVYAANINDLQVTHDEGAHWELVANGARPGGALALAGDPTVPGTVLAGDYGAGIYRTADQGDTWTASGQGLVNTAVEALAIAATDSALFVADFLGISRSLNGGASWDSTTIVGGPVRALAAAPSNAKRVYAATATNIFRTEDGGDNWTSVSSLASTVALAVTLKDPTRLYAATSQGLMKSTNSGATWTNVFQGRVVNVQSDPVDASVTYLVGQRGVWKSDTGGLRWQQLLPVTTFEGLAVGEDLPRTLLVSNEQSVYGSFDGGVDWTHFEGIRDVPRALAVDPNNSAILYIGSNTGIEQSVDGGLTFQRFNRGLFGRGITRLLFDPSDPRRLYAATTGAGLFVYEFP